MFDEWFILTRTFRHKVHNIKDTKLVFMDIRHQRIILLFCLYQRLKMEIRKSTSSVLFSLYLSFIQLPPPPPPTNTHTHILIYFSLRACCESCDSIFTMIQVEVMTHLSPGRKHGHTIMGFNTGQRKVLKRAKMVHHFKTGSSRDIPQSMWEAAPSLVPAPIGVQ